MTSGERVQSSERSGASVATRGVFGLNVENSRVVLLVLLTFVTGSVDAVSYLALDRVFTANMTGNVVLLGFAASGAGGLALFRSAAALLAFVVGAIVAGRVVRRADARVTWPLPVTVSLGTTAAILLAVFATWIGRDAVPLPDLLAPLLAFAMGMQGAATRKLGVADLPTTVVTSTLTGLAADSFLAGGSRTRWQRRAAAVISLLLGAVSGGLLVQVRPALGLLPALVVLVVVTGTITGARLHHPPKSS